MSNGRSETYQLEPLEGFETVAGDQTLRSQYSIIPENMRDEIENREVWNSIGDIGEGLGNILTGTAEGFGYDLSDPNSLLAELALSMFLPPTFKNVVKGTKKTKGLNPYQKTELMTKGPQKAKTYGDIRKLENEWFKFPHKYPTGKPPYKDIKSRQEWADKFIQDKFTKAGKDKAADMAKWAKEVNPYRKTLPTKVQTTKPLMDMVKKLDSKGVPIQQASKSTKGALKDIAPLLPFLIGGIGIQQMKGRGSAPDAESAHTLIDSLIIDTEPMELRQPSLEEKLMDLQEEISKWRY
jgi:hypothetical protein